MFSASFFHQSGCLNAVSMPYNNITPFSFFSFSFDNLIHVYVYACSFNLMTIQYCLQDQHNNFGPLWGGSGRNRDCFPVERISSRGQRMYPHNFFHFHLLPETSIAIIFRQQKNLTLSVGAKFRWIMLKDYLKPILTEAFGVVSAVFFCLSFLSTSIFTGSSLDSSSSSSSSPLSSSSENSNKMNLGWILVSVIVFYMYLYTVKETKQTTNYTQCICTYFAHLNQYMIYNGN